MDEKTKGWGKLANTDISSEMPAISKEFIRQKTMAAMEEVAELHRAESLAKGSQPVKLPGINPRIRGSSTDSAGRSAWK